MKTVLQELIEDLNREIDNCERNGLQYRGIYLDARWKAENLLEKEKEQITKSFIAGYNSRSNEDIIGGTGNEENEYYDSTFGYSYEAGI